MCEFKEGEERFGWASEVEVICQDLLSLFHEVADPHISTGWKEPGRSVGEALVC